MSISLADYEQRAVEAVALFWKTRGAARAKQTAGVDLGGRSAVTGGKNMDGFIELLEAVVIENGLPRESIFTAVRQHRKQRHTTLPGYYRPVKDLFLLVVHHDGLFAALEFKSQVGPSFGNNFNNRCEEAIGMGEDLRVAFREGRLGSPPRPFVGYLMLLEDTEASRSPVKTSSRHFPEDLIFENASYAGRYEILCQRFMMEGLYNAAALILSHADKGFQGIYTEMSEETGLKQLVAGFASHVAAASL